MKAGKAKKVSKKGMNLTLPQNILIDFGDENNNIFVKGKEKNDPEFYEKMSIILSTNKGDVKIYSLKSFFED